MISSLQDRISVLAKLGQKMKQASFFSDALVRQVSAINPWFTADTINSSAAAIANNYLDEQQLTHWTSDYVFPVQNPKKIGLILAGNIPMVGIHDILSVFISGHIAKIKLSEKDTLLSKHILAELTEIDAAAATYFEYVEKLENYDAVIATGSNSSSRYFEKYFSKVPHIIRKNRSGVAVIHKETTHDALRALGKDILSYYGLGCRSVSKVYFEQGVEFARLYEAIEDQGEIINHHKYKNNYDYTYALFLMAKKEFYTNDFLILRPDSAISSRISVLNYEYFDDLTQLTEQLTEQQEAIQCIISGKPLGALKVFNYGHSQSPALTDYADGVNTLDFLAKL